MLQIDKLSLYGDRWTPLVQTFQFEGFDLTHADFRAQVRLLPDTPGTPLIDLQTVTSPGAQGLRFVGVETVEDLPVSTVEMVISESVMEAMPPAAELGDDAVFHFDMHITLGTLKEKWIEATFIVRAGVTQ